MLGIVRRQRPQENDGAGQATRASKRRGRGQAVVEFALILPVFLLLTIGVVDMARIFGAYIALTNGVSNAALFAAQGGYGKWCSGVAGDIPCPTGFGGTNTASNASGNIAYQIQSDTSGLLPTVITMAPPVCTKTVGGTTENCQFGGPPKTYSQVKISASVRVTLFTPIISIFFAPTGILLSSSTTSVTY